MHSLDAFATAKLDALAAESLRRDLVYTARDAGVVVERGGRRYLSFSCNDYLNLSHHPAVLAAAQEAIARYGIGSGASRLVTGNHPLYGELEERLARLKGAEAACVFGSGYLTNTGVIPALAGADDMIVIDELAHACLFAGARMSGAAVHVFRHNDLAHAEELLAAHRGGHRHALVLTDGVFSMDGDLAPLPALGRLAKAQDAWLMADDAHGIGVLAGGRGSTYAFDEPADVPLQMGTLSKAIGGYGGYLCASRSVVDLMKSRARTLVYSTGLPPPVVAAAIAAIDLIEADPGMAEGPVAKARLFARRVGLPDPQSPIVPVVVGESEAALAASRMLAEAGYLVVAIRPPTVPPGTARLRLTFTPAHSDEDIERLADLIRDRILGTVS
ncbi:8-amino-7-oxononanoate synthase [Rhodoplanes roseus]|uniref:8-amino-7-ketopelargonate synthase n=2 Tax=Rhodoplanes TaxID=29407 RepID=A0A327L2R3_9BRAD|nr:8-amino-7-oxononanoate synthase [Rhodoplanes roseus]RAI44305.1 8-amino-7-oxononanoate synthase [Rhodoplanes roseus]